MALSDHFRELRARLLISVTAITVVAIGGLFLFDELFRLLMGPYKAAVENLDGVNVQLTVNGISGSLLLHLELAGTAALVLTSPLWLYQIWAFILPGLHPHERKWTRIFASIAGPLFLAGVALGYYTLAKGIEILVNFTPGGVTNLIESKGYVSFFIRTLLVFGIAFEIPVFVVMLNLAGILSGKTLGAHRAWIIMGTFVFAAVATPSTDPFGMLFLAVPMIVLFMISEVVARLLDRRRAKAQLNYELDDDEQSDIDETAVIDGRSSLDPDND